MFGVVVMKSSIYVINPHVGIINCGDMSKRSICKERCQEFYDFVTRFPQVGLGRDILRTDSMIIVKTDDNKMLIMWLYDGLIVADSDFADDFDEVMRRYIAFMMEFEGAGCRYLLSKFNMEDVDGKTVLKARGV